MKRAVFGRAAAVCAHPGRSFGAAAAAVTRPLVPKHSPPPPASTARRSITSAARLHAKSDQSSSDSAADPDVDSNDDGEPPSSAEIDSFLSTLPSSLPDPVRDQITAHLTSSATSHRSELTHLERDHPYDDVRLATSHRAPTVRERRPTSGFFNEDEGAEDPDPDDDFFPNDITTPAHFELEQERELRNFARAIVWDMPLLAAHRRPFVSQPSAARPLRWRYTTYMGEAHPAAKKVVLQFLVEDLPDLTPTQRSTMLKLVHPRWKPHTYTRTVDGQRQTRTGALVTMSAEYHPTPAQNKRHLAEQLARLLREVQEGADAFEDVPLDRRHLREKPRPRFPPEWKMTEERARTLQAAREARAALGDGVDGESVVQRMLAQGAARSEKEAVTVGAGRGAGAKAAGKARKQRA